MINLYRTAFKFIFELALVWFAIDKLSLPLLAQWSSDPNVNNPICTAVNNQVSASIVSDGAGGAIITWADQRTSNWDIYAQRISPGGVVLWSTNGVPISVATGNQYSPLIMDDEAGGAIIAWIDYRDSIANGADIYAQHINSDGVVQWTANGVVVSAAANDQIGLTMTKDGSRGAIIAWMDSRIDTNDIYAQRINAEGTESWTNDGIVISSAVNSQNGVTIASDSVGGAILAWLDFRNSDGIAPDSAEIYAQHIDSSGVIQWFTGGVAISNVGDDEFIFSATITSDDNGGAIISWIRGYAIPYVPYQINDLYAQRINSDGSIHWATNGVLIPISGEPLSQTLTQDGNNGTIIALMAYDGNNSIFVQRIDSGGVIRWSPGGVKLSGVSIINYAEGQSLIADGAGGAIVTWGEDRQSTTDYDIYAQRIDSSGIVQWEIGGITISMAQNHQESPYIINDGAGGGIIAWEDYRDGGSGDIYAQRVPSNGILGAPTIIFSVEKGWNLISIPLVVSDYGKLNLFPTSITNAYSYNGTYTISDTLKNGIGYWLKFSAVQNLSLEGLPILLDTITVVEGWNLIGSITTPISTSSISSIPPGSVMSKFFSYSGGYSTTDTIYPGKGYWVKADQSGSIILSLSSSMSVSARIKIVPTDELPPSPPTSNLRDWGLSAEFTLEQNFPNPFNPTTAIQFVVPEKAHVQLQIFNVLGQVVATPVDGEEESGYKSVQWDASTLTSGVYFYRMTAGTFIETRKMLLIR